MYKQDATTIWSCQRMRITQCEEHDANSKIREQGDKALVNSLIAPLTRCLPVYSHLGTA
jgi:hypothetical protein